MYLGAWQVWLVVAIVLAVAEILTAGFFIIWFALGAGVAVIAALLGLNIYWQIGFFLLISLLLVVFTRPLVERFVHRQDSGVKTNLEALKGKEGLVTEPIDNLSGTGQVKVQGEIWSARCTGGDQLPAGTRIVVAGLDGVRLIVQEQKE
jgi:membrane protein implicated in regulation of membrane protease activity